MSSFLDAVENRVKNNCRNFSARWGHVGLVTGWVHKFNTFFSIDKIGDHALHSKLFPYQPSPLFQRRLSVFSLFQGALILHIALWGCNETCCGVPSLVLFHSSSTVNTTSFYGLWISVVTWWKLLLVRNFHSPNRIKAPYSRVPPRISLKIYSTLAWNDSYWYPSQR